jgi:hypothetical protein
MVEAKKKPRRGPKQVSGVYSVTLYNEELGLVEGIARALKKQGVSVRRDTGLTNKLMLMKESIRQAAEKLGRDTGDKALVDLAEQLKVSFQTPKVRGRPGDDSRSGTVRRQVPVQRKGK